MSEQVNTDNIFWGEAAIVSSQVEPSDWVLHARCRDSADILFADNAKQREARQMCRECPVWAECLAEALDNRIEWGVWGGMTERERRRLLRKHSDVRSWRELIRRHQQATAGAHATSGSGAR